MNNHQLAKQESFKLIVSETKSNPESVDKVPKFGAEVLKLEVISKQIDVLHLEQAKDITGITTDKMLSFEQIIDLILEISGAIYSYAAEKGNNALKTVVNYKPTMLINSTQAEVVNIAGIVVAEAKKLTTAELLHEGISAEDITEFETLIEYFKGIKSANREAVIDRSGITAKINELFKEASLLITEKLDKLAVQFKRKDPEFYLKYKAARTVNYRVAAKKTVTNTTGA